MLLSRMSLLLYAQIKILVSRQTTSLVDSVGNVNIPQTLFSKLTNKAVYIVYGIEVLTIVLRYRVNRFR